MLMTPLFCAVCRQKYGFALPRQLLSVNPGRNMAAGENIAVQLYMFEPESDPEQEDTPEVRESRIQQGVSY